MMMKIPLPLAFCLYCAVWFHFGIFLYFSFSSAALLKALKASLHSHTLCPMPVQRVRFPLDQQEIGDDPHLQQHLTEFQSVPFILSAKSEKLSLPGGWTTYASGHAIKHGATLCSASTGPMDDDKAICSRRLQHNTNADGHGIDSSSTTNEYKIRRRFILQHDVVSAHERRA